ncbi:MAG TPA: PKD domain-containing protein [Gemmatimonadales bacterium]
MRPTQWRSLGLTLAVAAVVACGKDSNDPDPDGNNAAPTADFSSSCAGLTCSFTDLSVDSDGQIASYSWDFGGEGGSDEKNPSFTFPAEGEVSVTLTVADDGGAEDAAVRSVTLTVPVAGGPTADFSVTCSSLDCTFQDLSTDADGTVVAWTWEFSDGGESSEQHPVHHYDVSNRTLVSATLTVTDDENNTSSKTTEFTVSPAATLQCESAPGTGEFASCALELLEDATVTVTLESRSCDAHGNTFRITAPIVETLFEDGCYAPALGEPFNLNDGGVFAAGTLLAAEVISGATNQLTAPALHVTGAYPTWTLSFDDGVGGPGEPDFDDLVLTVTADPVD